MQGIFSEIADAETELGGNASAGDEVHRRSRDEDREGLFSRGRDGED